MVAINDQLDIPDGELQWSASRSSGPGGQNVNKVSSRVTLTFDVDATETLTGEQKELLRERLATRISKAGVLRVVAQRERSQAANRRLATERFAELVARALEVDPVRKRRRVSKGAKRRRLEDKRRRSRLKRDRSAPRRYDDE